MNSLRRICRLDYEGTDLSPAISKPRVPRALRGGVDSYIASDYAQTARRSPTFADLD